MREEGLALAGESHGHALAQTFNALQTPPLTHVPDYRTYTFKTVRSHIYPAKAQRGFEVGQGFFFGTLNPQQYAPVHRMNAIRSALCSRVPQIDLIGHFIRCLGELGASREACGQPIVVAGAVI